MMKFGSDPVRTGPEPEYLYCWSLVSGWVASVHADDKQETKGEGENS